jgi:hypothetical protein
MHDRLIIIGNGFDLYHGIKSSYYNFKEYLYNNSHINFLISIEKYIPSDELWSNFEQALCC